MSPWLVSSSVVFILPFLLPLSPSSRSLVNSLKSCVLFLKASVFACRETPNLKAEVQKVIW